MAEFENTQEVSVSCEDDAGDILQPNVNLRTVGWAHSSSELITENEVNADQQEICESLVEEIIVEQENYVTCLEEECMEESIVYVFEEPVVDFDLSDSHYIIQEQLTYDLEVAVEEDNMNSSFSQSTNKDESSPSVSDEGNCVQPSENYETSIIKNAGATVKETKGKVNKETVANDIEINKSEAEIDIYSTSKTYSISDSVISNSQNREILQSSLIVETCAESSECCASSEMRTVRTVSPMKLADSLYGDDDPVTNTFVATLSSPLTSRKDSGNVEQKSSEENELPVSPRTPVLQNVSHSIVTSPCMLPSVLNRNKFTPTKKALLNLHLELPTLTEPNPVSVDSNSKDSPLAGVKSVLGKEQIKKRLQSFSLLKQGIQPIPIKKIINVKQPRVQVQISDEYDENGKKLDEKLVTVKKPPKQGTNPQEKAKAVIDEIEQIKREEAARLETNYLFYHKHNFPVNASYSIKDQTNPEHLISKKTKAALDIVEKVFDEGSRTPPHKNPNSKDKKYSKEHSKERRHKNSESDKSEKKKHEQFKDEKMPKDWAEIKKFNYEFNKIAKIKEKTLKSLTDAHKSPDKRSGNHKRFQEDDKNSIYKREEIAKPQLMFEYPSLPRQHLIALSVKGKSKYYPPEIIKYTEKYPIISYCENPNHARGYYRTRKQILSEISAERSHIMLQIIENKTRCSAEPVECVVGTKSWYPANEFLYGSKQNIIEKEPVISYGLSVLSESYNDDVEENVDSPAKIGIEEKGVKNEETLKSDNKEMGTLSMKSKNSSKSKDKSKSISKSKEKTSSHKKPSKSKSDEETKISSKPKIKMQENSLPRSPFKPDLNEDKTPNTEEYRSNWESDEDIMTEIMRPDYSKSYLRSNSLDKKWESEEELHDKYSEKQKYDNKYVEKRRRRSSSDRASEERIRRRSEDNKRKSRNSYSLEERVSDTEERHSHSSKHSHQNIEYKKSIDLKYDIEEKLRHATDYLVYNKWSSEEDVTRSVTGKYDNRNKRNDNQKLEKKDSKERSNKHFEDFENLVSSPGFNHRKSQWSEDEECERRKIAAEFEKRSRHDYEMKLSKNDENRALEKDRQFKPDELRMFEKQKHTKQTYKTDDRLKSRWEEEFKQLESAKYRNKERHEDLFEKDPKDFINFKEYERKHRYWEEFREKNNRSEERDDFEHGIDQEEEQQKDKYRKEKLKNKEKNKKKNKDKKPKVTINYSDLEENLDEEFRSDKKQKDVSLFKEENITRSRPKIKIDYSDFDMSLIESKDKLEENIYSRTLGSLGTPQNINSSINFDMSTNVQAKECIEVVKTINEVLQVEEENLENEIEIEEKITAVETSTTKNEVVYKINTAVPMKPEPVYTLPEISPVAPPVLPIPVPITKPIPPEDQLVSAYEEFMKAVFSNEAEDESAEKDTSHNDQSSEQKPKEKIEKSESTEKPRSPIVNEKSETPPKAKKKEASVSSNESSSETETSDSEDHTDDSSDESSDTNSESAKLQDINQSINETVKNIKTEVLSDSEKEYERKVRSDKRKRSDTSDDESSNLSNNDDFNPNMVIKSEKDGSKKMKKIDLCMQHLEYDESKYKNVIDWETSYSGSNTGYIDIFKPTDYVLDQILPRKFPIIDITEMATSSVLPENIPLPNDITIVQNISTLDIQVESPRNISTLPETQTSSPKKSRSLIPIKLLTAENRKQANETAKNLTKPIIPPNEVCINMNSIAETSLCDNLEDVEFNLSRKRQSQWNMNLTPAKKLLLQNTVMGDDSDEDFTDKFIKQSEKKLNDKDFIKKSEGIINDHFDIASKDTECFTKTELKIEAEHKDTKISVKSDTEARKELEYDRLFIKESHDKSRHSPEQKTDKNFDSRRSDRRSSSIGRLDKRSSRRLSHERGNKDRGRDSLERKRERSKERPNRELQKDRGRKRMPDRRFPEKKPGLGKGKSRYSRERELNRFRGRERSKERERYREQNRVKDKSVERGRDRSVERGRDRSVERGRDRSMERGRDRSMERGRDRSVERGRDRSLERSRDRNIERGRDRSPDRPRDRSMDRGRDRSPDRISDRCMDRNADRNIDRSRDRSSDRMKGSLDRVRDRSPMRIRDRSSDRIRDRSPDRIRERSPDRVRDRSIDRTLDRGRDRSPDMPRDRSPGRLRNPSLERIMDRSMDRRSPIRPRDRSMDRTRDRSPDRFRNPERIIIMDRGRELRDRSVDRYRERDHRDRERNHRESDRYPPRTYKRDDPRRYSRSPSPARKDRRSDVENIPIPCRTLPDDTDFSATSMDIVHSPVNSPLDGFKRSLADSTISDSELIAQLNTPDESNEPSPAYTQLQYYPSVQDLQPSQVQSPSSPKRISLDDRINLVLGIEKEPPKQIGTVCTRGPYNNQTQYHDPYAYGRTEYDMYSAPPSADPYANAPYPNQYHQPYYPSQLNNDNNIKVVQVGNVIQVVPTEQTAPPPPIAAPIPKVNEVPPKVVQVGNMLQIVPMTVMDNTSVASPLITVAPNILPPATVALVEKTPAVSKPIDQLAMERRAEKEKRRQERELRRKEKEKKRREKEKRKQLKNKLKTENMIKRALMLETGEGELDISNAETELLNEAIDSSNLPLPWPPATMLSTQPLLKPPGKGILVTHGFRREKEEGSSEDNVEPRRIVKFADGICPGEGTSPSGGEELPSPPPPPRKLPKEKRYKKLKNKNKKKIKVKIIRTQQQPPEEGYESEDNLPPPPPPPGSPPPHLWPPRLKQPPVNNIHPSLPGNVYPPNPYPPPPQQVMFPAAYPAPGPQQVSVVIGHTAPPPPQGPRHHHPPVMPVMQPGPPQHVGPPPQHVGPPPPPHHATHHGPPQFHH